MFGSQLHRQIKINFLFFAILRWRDKVCAFIPDYLQVWHGSGLLSVVTVKQSHTEINYNPVEFAGNIKRVK